VWSWVRETGSTILRQLEAIGCSCDWTRTRFTLDPGLSRAVREVFVRLYEKGLIYRGNYIINWCPRCLTALSNEEAEGVETAGKLYHLRYPLAGPPPEGARLPTLPDGRAYLVVATTRPETMLGDTAVAVHPEDERYRALIGREVELPLTGRRIPIVADEYVDREFGSGAVKITPAHDPNDFEVAQRHGLPALNVMTPEATMNENAPAEFRGLDRFEARRRVVDALAAAQLLERVEDHTHSVPHCYRCDTVVEPRLSEQWFVRMRPLAEPALAASREGRVRFTPQRWTKVYEDWLENIRDWCISRQLWWGHRIPVWYCRAEGCGETIVAREDPTHCPRCGSDALEQDPDVLDTWFSSWLWPFSTLGWPDETEDLKAFYPTSTLVTAPEILFFWVARMIMAGLEFMGKEPFREVYLHGTVRDHLGRKMSKSLGNGIDPLAVVELYGADALRYTIVSQAGPGTDLYMNYEDIESTFAPGRNFANKVWNVGRFALLRLGDEAVPALEDVKDSLELADRWILSRLSVAVREVTRHLEAFRLHEAANTLYHFFWGELADWYVELVKPRLAGEAGEASRAAARATLVEVLDQAFRLMHPVMPFVTEALWVRLPRPAGRSREESLVVARWPEHAPDREDPEAEAAMSALIELIGSVRGLRKEYEVPVSQELELRLSNVSAALRGALEAEERAVRRLARVREILVDGRAPEAGEGKAPGAHAVLRDGVELFIPLAGVLDIEHERRRLEAEMERLRGLLRAVDGKLANEQFVTRAPESVVAREREKAQALRDQLERLSAKLAALS
jgi:valyl-tRNA synthetase